MTSALHAESSRSASSTRALAGSSSLSATSRRRRAYGPRARQENGLSLPSSTHLSGTTSPHSTTDDCAVPTGTLSKANIDHMAVTPSGVWVIDAKTHQGSVEVRRSGGLFSPRVEALFINGRDQTRLVHGLLKQVDAVRHELSAVEAGIAVQGALCFVGTELPWFGSSSIADVPVVGRRGLAKLLLRQGGRLSS